MAFLVVGHSRPNRSCTSSGISLRPSHTWACKLLLWWSSWSESCTFVVLLAHIVNQAWARCIAGKYFVPRPFFPIESKAQRHSATPRTLAICQCDLLSSRNLHSRFLFDQPSLLQNLNITRDSNVSTYFENSGRFNWFYCVKLQSVWVGPTRTSRQRQMFRFCNSTPSWSFVKSVFIKIRRIDSRLFLVTVLTGKVIRWLNTSD